jgi:hypothetical protein
VKRLDDELNCILGQQDRSKDSGQTWSIAYKAAIRRSQESRFIKPKSHDAKYISPR